MRLGTSYLGNTVTKLRGSDGMVLGAFLTGSGPLGVATDGANIWTANNRDNTVTKLQASDGMVLGTFLTGLGPNGLAFDGINIWTANVPNWRKQTDNA